MANPFETRSYTIKFDVLGGAHLEPSWWQPGYTAAYKATPEEAIAAARRGVEQQIKLLQAKLTSLDELLENHN